MPGVGGGDLLGAKYHKIKLIVNEGFLSDEGVVSFCGILLTTTSGVVTTIIAKKYSQRICGIHVG